MLESRETCAVDRATSLALKQDLFAAHLRDPEHAAVPVDVEERRMAIYRDLVYRNIDSLLQSSFPVLVATLPARHWHEMVRDFLVRHRCATPLFTEVAQEFLDYLGRTHQPLADDPPYLLELAHFEWVATALKFSDDEPDPSSADPNGDLLDESPVLSPLAWPLTYRFPVHRIGPDFQPTEPPSQPTHLLRYRDGDDAVQCLLLNPVTQRLLALIADNPERRSGRALLTAIAEELGHPRPQQVIDGGQAQLLDLRRRGVILGTLR
jgi:hypothetical protein